MILIGIKYSTKIMKSTTISENLSTTMIENLFQKVDERIEDKHSKKKTKNKETTQNEETTQNNETKKNKETTQNKKTPKIAKDFRDNIEEPLKNKVYLMRIQIDFDIYEKENDIKIADDTITVSIFDKVFFIK